MGFGGSSSSYRFFFPLPDPPTLKFVYSHDYFFLHIVTINNYRIINRVGVDGHSAYRSVRRTDGQTAKAAGRARQGVQIRAPPSPRCCFRAHPSGSAIFLV